MKRKIFSILFALVLALSLSLIPAMPVAAATPIYVNALTGDNANDGETPDTAVATIAKGIELVDSGGTVNVAAGTYEEKIKIMDKSLTLLGAQADVPIVDGERAGDESIIRGKVDWRGRPSTYCLVRIQQSDVVVNGFTIVNAKQWNIAITGSSIRREGISNVVVSYNYIVESRRDGIFRDNAAANVAITHNYIASNSRGILTNGGGTTITNNTFYGNGKGIDFMGGDPYSVYFPDYDEPKYSTTISGNTFTNDSTSITLRLDKCHQSITVTGNDITEARSAAIKTWNVYDADIADPAIHYNNISNNEFGINNQVTEINLDATNNWWGDCSGPSGVGSGTGDAVSANVNYDPWLGKQLCELKVAIAELSDTDFNKPKAASDQRQALLNKLDAVCEQIDDGAYRGAINKLQHDVINKIGKWIVPDEQGALIDKVNTEIEILENFL